MILTFAVESEWRFNMYTCACAPFVNPVWRAAPGACVLVGRNTEASVPSGCPSTALPLAQLPDGWGGERGGAALTASLLFCGQPSTTPVRLPTSSATTGTASPSGGPATATWTARTAPTRIRPAVVSAGALAPPGASLVHACCWGEAAGKQSCPPAHARPQPHSLRCPMGCVQAPFPGEQSAALLLRDSFAGHKRRPANAPSVPNTVPCPVVCQQPASSSCVHSRLCGQGFLVVVLTENGLPTEKLHLFSIIDLKRNSEVVNHLYNRSQP